MIIYDIFVYCGGKCGSATMQKTFIENNYCSIHIHSDYYYKEINRKKKFENIYKNMNMFFEGLKSCLEKNFNDSPNINIYINNNYNDSSNINICINNHYNEKINIDGSIFDVIDFSCKSKEKIYFFDSYRTPIERKISSFFQNIHRHLPNYNELKMEEIIDFFNKNHIYSLEEYHSINELLEHYSIPLFNTFDFDKGYNIIEKDNKVIVKVLFKHIYKWNIIFSEILKKNIVIYNDNVTKNKRYYNLYTEFREKYKVPKLYLEDLLLKDREFKIYNTIKEQEEYINYWKNNSY